LNEPAANMVIRSFVENDRHGVVELWQRCGLVVPQNDPHRDIDLKAAFQGDLFLVGLINGTVTATVMAGYDGHRGWINYLAVDPSFQEKGLGRKIMAQAETHLIELGCPKINLQVRTSNTKVIGFYKSLGFQMDEVVSLGKRLAPSSKE
jgi:ribosomal protein S18 acetylase RimI-like enzyme